MKKIRIDEDPLLKQIILELVENYQCHTVILYGSRARGDANAKSDYDIIGIRTQGKKFRLAERRKGIYLDIFIFNQTYLLKNIQEFLHLKEAKILIQKRNIGTKFLKKIQSELRKPIIKITEDESCARKVWFYKMLERISLNDIEANFRRVCLQQALLIDYFELRGMRYWGPKESFLWLKKNDKVTFGLFDKVLKNPFDLNLLKKLIKKVTP